VPNADGLIYVSTKGSHTFNGTPFTLARSGAYIGTGDFGGTGGSVTVSSPGYPSGSSGDGFNTPVPVGTGSAGTGTTALTPPVVAVDYIITYNPADDCSLPGKIKFTVSPDGSIDPASVLFGLPGSSGYLGPLSQDVYTIDNLNSGLILHATPKSILKSCMNDVKVGTTNGDFILTAGEGIQVVIPALTGGASFGVFELYTMGNSVTPVFSSGTALASGSTNFSPGLSPGLYNFKIPVTMGATANIIKGQIIVK
jgi:hypothetical protein